MNNTGEIIQTISIILIVANFLNNTGRVLKAIELSKECLFILDNTLLIKEKQEFKLLNKDIYWRKLTAYLVINDGTNAVKYARKILQILRECGNRFEECTVRIILASWYLRQSKYMEAKEHSKKALQVNTDIGDKKREGSCYEILAAVYQAVGKHENAKEYLVKALAIRKEIGDRNGEASCYGNLATVLQSLGEYKKAKEYLGGAIAIEQEIGDRKGVASTYENFGSVLISLGEYEKAKQYLEVALAINKEIGDREGEASCYGNIGYVFQSVGEFVKAKEYYERALEMKKEFGDRDGEATAYGNLGTLFESVGEYRKAKEYLEKALLVRKEMGDRKGEASSYRNLGTVLIPLREYEKAKENLEEALAINKEIGDKEGEASSYGNLGIVFQSVGDFVKAKEYHERAFAISRDIGYREEERAACGNLGTVLISLKKYAKANEYLQKALALSKENGDKNGEAGSYEHLGIMFTSIGDYEKAKEYLEKALTISKEIGDKYRESSSYKNLAVVFEFCDEYVKAEEYQKRALAICEEIGDVQNQSRCLYNLGCLMLREGKIQEALSYLLPSIQKCEDLRGFLRDNDQFKISFSHELGDPYRILTALFCVGARNANQALYVSELRRARALADLMSAQYSVKNQISADPQSWVGIESVVNNKSSCLYFSCLKNVIFLCLLKAKRVVHFENQMILLGDGLIENLDEFFTKERFRNFRILPEKNCEDRSLNDIERKLCEEEIRKASRNENDGKDNQDSLKRNLSLCHKLLIAPMVELIDGPEIIIVPEGSLYNIPFAALLDECGNYLSETFRIRVVPSLTTLKLIQDSPADYHSQTGALIVGNPDVGKVHLHGRLRNISPLPCAESEATMIGEKLGVEPLLGKQATKQAVLQVINSVSLIHFAAHGDDKRGEIALAPALRTPNGIPQEKDYLLTMSDISKVQLRAKLVVLSCCHSGRGQIRAEGVVGIARAFLGSGARSVLVALWAVDDTVTEQFMSRFYEHLVGGDSASESLHETMKWMRCNGYSDVRQWAPFMLIGDDVTFDFGKSR